MRAPVSACLIVRDEGPRIIACLESLRPHVAELVVLDTGSGDDTVARIRASGMADKLETFYECNEGGLPSGAIEDFSMARNRSFSLATQPWILWADADDVVRGAENLPSICERIPRDAPHMVLFPYEYAHDHNGNVTCRHYRERLVPRHLGCRWHGPVHEVLMPPAPCSMEQSDLLTFVHSRAGKGGDAGRNLRILQKWLAKHGESDARMLYYTGLEYANANNLPKSVEYHEKYVAVSGWDDEKCLSCLELSRHCLALGQEEKAEAWALKASAVAETWREPVFALGRLAYAKAQKSGQRRDWERAANYFRRGLAMPPTQTMLFLNPMEARYEVHQYQTVALASIGAIHEALASCEAALAAVPGDPNATHNKHFFRTCLAKARAEEAISELEGLGKVRADYGIGADAARLARSALAGKFRVDQKIDVPLEGAANQNASSAALSFAPAPITALPGKLDVVIFTGAAYERWSPETLERGGMGGSETMAWEMARRLRRLGHGVRVFADCVGMEGVYEGVEWLNQDRYLEQGERAKCDVLISSRIPDLVDFEFKARARVAWVHDVHMGAGLTNKRALKFDRFLCLSNWHKQFFLDQYKYVHESAVVVTRNGIDLSRYEGEEARDPHRMIYSSSPDRGLLAALQCLPGIRARVPDASLHVFYGFENWEKSGDPAQQQNAQIIKGMLGAYANFGAVNHGRVHGRELAKEQLKSGVWAYPTWFHETNCITAMEAQAAGLRCVTSPIAALNETLGAEHGYMVQGDWLSPAYQAEFTERVVACMLHGEVATEPRMDRERQKARARRDFSLDALAQEWSWMLERFVAEVERDVVPRYRAAGE